MKEIVIYDLIKLQDCLLKLSVLVRSYYLSNIYIILKIIQKWQKNRIQKLTSVAHPYKSCSSAIYSFLFPSIFKHDNVKLFYNFSKENSNFKNGVVNIDQVGLYKKIGEMNSFLWVFYQFRLSIGGERL